MLAVAVPALAYPYMRPAYPNYVDFYNGSVTMSFSNNTQKVNGSYRALNLKYTKEPNMPSISLGIGDMTWTESLYNDSENPVQDLQREIVLNYGLFDGNYSSSPSQFWVCRGYYYPNVTRGVATCQYQNGFVFGSDFTLNSSEIEKYALDVSGQWPPEEYYNIPDFEDKRKRGDDGTLTARYSPSVVFFNLTRTGRPADSRYNYPFDNGYRKEWRQEGVSVDGGETYQVPTISAVIIGNETGYIINLTSQIVNTAWQQKSSLAFCAAIILVQIAFFFCNVKLAIDIDTQIRLQSLNLGSIVFLLNAQYLETILFIASPSMLSGVTNIMCFLGFLNAGSLFPLIFRITTLYVQNINQMRHTQCQIIGRLMGMLLGTILPAVIIIILAYFIPLVATFVLVMISTSYMIAYVLILLIKNYKPTYPLYYVFLNFVDKSMILCYLFGMYNAYGIEYANTYYIIVLCLLGIPSVIYLVYYFAGGRCGMKCCRSKYTMDYGMQYLSGRALYQLRPYNSTTGLADPIILTYEKPYYRYFLTYSYDEQISRMVCANPTHYHSTGFLSNEMRHLYGIPYFRYACYYLGSRVKNPEYLTNCFTYVERASLTEFCCSICFDDLKVDRANQGLFVRLFGKYSGSLFRQEGALLRANGYTGRSEIWITACGHIFHRECLQKWMEENYYCPVDRQVLLPPE